MTRDKVQAARLAERRACLKIARECYKNELAWGEAYYKKGPPEMYHNAQGGANMAVTIIELIEDRSKRRRKNVKRHQ